MRIEINIDFPKEILEIKSRFKFANKDFLLVGGCVRDMILGMPVTDLDFATDATTEEMEKILKGYSFEVQGAHFGVMRVFVNETSYEIASYRQDVTFGRKPEVKLGVSRTEDAKRRDFTINALYYDISKDEVLDDVFGLHDLKDRVIRTPGPADIIFDQDRLRVLRAVRFKNKIAGVYHEGILQAIAENNALVGINAHGDMEELSAERVVEEFLKGIKQALYVKEYIADMLKFGLLQQVFKMDKVSWGPAPESRRPEIVMARLLAVFSFHDPKILEELHTRLVEECRFPKRLVKGVTLLLRMYTVKPENAFKLAKLQNGTDLTRDDLLEYVSCVDPSAKNIHNMRAFCEYEVLNNGAELVEAGFKGAALGDEQRKIETERFTSISKKWKEKI